MESSTRKIVAIVTGSALALTLSACAGGGSAPKSSGPVDVGFWSWVGGVDAPTKIWNEKNPDITVTHETVAYGDIWTKARAAIGAGDAPCLVAAARTDVPQLVSEGLLEDVTSLAKKYKDDYLGFAWNETAVAGHSYGLPWDSGPATYFYRPSVFTAAGVDVPTSYDDLLPAAEAVQKSAPGTKIFWLPADAIQDFSNYAEQAGASWFTVDGDTWKVDMTDPATLKVAALFDQLVAKGLVETKQTGDPSIANDVKSGTLSGLVRGSWMNGQIASWAPDDSGKWAAALPPMWSNGSSFNSGGSALLVTKGCKDPEQALDYAHWLTTSDDALNLLGTPEGGGIYPAGVAALDAPVFAQPSAFFSGQVLGDTFAKSAKAVKVGADWNWPPIWADLASGMADDYAAAVNGHGSFADVMEKAEKMAVQLMKARGIKAELAD